MNRQRQVILAASTAGTAIALAVVTNVATSDLPSWLRWLQPSWRAWTALGGLTLITLILTVRATLAQSMRASARPSIDHVPAIGAISGGSVIGNIHASGGTVIQAPGATFHLPPESTRSEHSDRGVESGLDLDERQVSHLHSPAYPSYHVPTTEDETNHLLRERPRDWAWLLFAGTLTQHRDALSPKWQRHLSGVSWHQAQPEKIRPAVTWHLLQDERIAILQEIVDAGEVIRQVPSRRSFQDIDGHDMRKSALDAMATYEHLLDRASRIRSLNVTSEFSRARDLLADYVTMPLEGFHGWIDEINDGVSHLPELDLGGPIDISWTLHPDLDEEIERQLDREMDRTREMLGGKTP